MVITINDIEYTTSVSNGTTTVSWDTGSLSSGRSERALLRTVTLKLVRSQRDKLLAESDVHEKVYNEQLRLRNEFPTKYGTDIDEDGYLELLMYRQELRDLPTTYRHGKDITLPVFPGIYG